jgi:hypothetical protein
VTRAAWLALALFACGKGSGTPTDCGGPCGGTGPVQIKAYNISGDSLIVRWWWRGVRGDSVKLGPFAGWSGCITFTATTWAQIEADQGSGPRANWTGVTLTPAFDPVADPWWSVQSGTPPTVSPQPAAVC